MTSATCVVKCVVVNSRDRALLLRRSASDPSRPNDYDFPGGGIDDGEMIEQALLRELKEECGLVIEHESLKLVYADTGLKNGEPLVRVLFAAMAKDEPVTLSEEHASYEWVPKSSVAELWKHPVWSAGVTYAINHGLI